MTAGSADSVDHSEPASPIVVHPIEVESYRILADRVDLSPFGETEQKIVGRMIHATADTSFAQSVRIGSQAAAALIKALDTGAPIIVDANMIRAGITRYPTSCYLSRVPVAPTNSTRSAAAFVLAAQEYPEGAVFVVGTAPTALFELIRLHETGLVRPAAIIGLPVGFVGAKESKAALWQSSLAPISVTNVGERGGSAPAAGAVNAIVRHIQQARELRGETLKTAADPEPASMGQPLTDPAFALLPVSLQVGGKRCVVVGGGRAGLRKAKTLLAAGARVTIIDPELVKLAGAEQTRRDWRSGDAKDALITVAATNDPGINRAVAADARTHGSLILRADDPGEGQLQFPAVLREADLTVAVDTAGSSPMLAAYLRDKISEQTTHWGDLLQWARQNRPVTKAQLTQFEDQLITKQDRPRSQPQ